MTTSVATRWATYDTLRGRFKILGIGTFDLLLERSDGRYAFVALSDWQTWSPTVVAATPVETQHLVDDSKHPTEGKEAPIVDTIRDTRG